MAQDADLVVLRTHEHLLLVVVVHVAKGQRVHVVARHLRTERIAVPWRFGYF